MKNFEKVLKNVVCLKTIALCIVVLSSCEKKMPPGPGPAMDEILNAPITKERAIEIALAYVPESKLISCELTTDHDVSVYSIDVANRESDYRFLVNAANGEIEGVLVGDDMMMRAANNGVDISNFISDSEAKAIALKLAGGGQITLCRLSYVHGVAEYEVGVVNGEMTYVVFINAYTGDINRFTRESNSQVTTPVTPPDSQPTNTNVENAKNTALAKVGGGTVVRVETHYAPHGTEYKVIIVNGDYKYCVHVNASTGYVMDMHSDPITKVGPGAYGYTAAINADKARSIAIQSAGGGIVTECNLNYTPHLATLSYHIHVANGQYEYCVEINATTGAVFKVEPRYKP